MRLPATIPVASLVASLVAGVALALGPAYAITHRTALGAEGGWDYLAVDTAAHRLFIARGTHVQVVDTDTDALVGDLPDTRGVHGIAINTAAHRGFTSNGLDSSVTVFDTKTLLAEARIHVPAQNPDAILFDEATQRVFTFNGGSASTTAINAKRFAVVGTLALGGKPEFATSDGRGTIFVNIEDTHEIVAFDAKKLSVTHRWLLDGCTSPTGQALDRTHQRLFAVCSNKVMVVLDASTGRQVASVPIGAGSDGVIFDDNRQVAITANGEGSMTVVHEDTPDTYTVVQTLPTMKRARTLTLDARTHALYTVSGESSATAATPSSTTRSRAPGMANGVTLLTIAAP